MDRVPVRVALVTTVPAPYRTPVWAALDRLTGELHVYSCAPVESDRVWEVDDLESFRFTHTFLRGLTVYIKRWEHGLYVNPSVVRELRRLRPHAIVITGYQTLSFVAVIAYAKVHRVPLVLWWESHAASSRITSGVVARVRRFLIRRADSYVTVGTRSTDYLREMGVPEAAVTTGFNAVDVETVARVVANRDVSQDDRVRFLFVGQLIERKGIRELLEAFRTLPPGTARLEIVGYGPLEPELREYVRRNGMDDVSFAGATRTLEETVRHYADADFLVMPSHREVWGLVLNEALATGLPVLASRQAGATVDLVAGAPIDVGLTFDSSEVDELRAALVEAIRRRGLYDRAAIAEWGRSFTPAALASSIDEAIRRAVAQRRSVRSS